MINYLEIDDWITLDMFRFQPYTEGFNCFQFELYGCPAGNLIFYIILEYKYLERLKCEHTVVTTLLIILKIKPDANRELFNLPNFISFKSCFFLYYFIYQFVHHTSRFQILMKPNISMEILV